MKKMQENMKKARNHEKSTRAEIYTENYIQYVLWCHYLFYLYYDYIIFNTCYGVIIFILL
jgi:hypothetical protein